MNKFITWVKDNPLASVVIAVLLIIVIVFQMPDITNLLNDIKKYRNDMVARNYPYQEISDIITKWEDHLVEVSDIKNHKDDQ